jgi:hypothetical protein
MQNGQFENIPLREYLGVMTIKEEKKRAEKIT